jgi:hypothetical protein
MLGSSLFCTRSQAVHGSVLCSIAVLSLFWGSTAGATQDQPVRPALVQERPGDAEARLRTTYVLGPDDQILIRAVDIPDIEE